MSFNYPIQTPRYWGEFATTGAFPGVAASEINLQAGDYAATTKGVFYVCVNRAVTPAKWLPVPGGGVVPYKKIAFADSTFALSLDPTAAGFAPIGGKLAVDTSAGNVTVQLPTAAAMGTDPLLLLQQMYKVTTDANTILVARAPAAAYNIQGVASDYTWTLSGSAAYPWISLFWDGTAVWVF